MDAAKLITFEGCDGSGKTTLLGNIKSVLEGHGYRVLVTREFGSPHDSLCVKLRELAISKDIPMTELVNQMLFAAMARQHHEQVVSKARTSGEYDFILCDRGTDSNYAYAPVHGLQEETVQTLFNLAYSDIPRPDLTVYVDIDAELGAKRRAKRGNEPDRVEAKGIELQQKVRLAFLFRFLSILETAPASVAVVSAKEDKTPAMITKEALKAIAERFDLPISNI